MGYTEEIQAEKVTRSYVGNSPSTPYQSLNGFTVSLEMLRPLVRGMFSLPGTGLVLVPACTLWWWRDTRFEAMVATPDKVLFWIAFHGPVIAFNITIPSTNAIAIMMSISSGLNFMAIFPLGRKVPSDVRPRKGKTERAIVPTPSANHQR